MYKMASQPFTGVNQRPLVFAQIRNGSTAVEANKARVCVSHRVINIRSNRFLHLFYQKPYYKSGYCHEYDSELKFQIKSNPDMVVDSHDMHERKALDGTGQVVALAEKQVLTLSDKHTWEFKPTVRVADFFANSLGVPIDCWTPCSRMAISRELEDSDLLRYEEECGMQKTECAFSAGELAKALNANQPWEMASGNDLAGEVQLSILFTNANPKIQHLDFRMRINIVPTVQVGKRELGALVQQKTLGLKLDPVSASQGLVAPGMPVDPKFSALTSVEGHRILLSREQELKRQVVTLANHPNPEDEEIMKLKKEIEELQKMVEEQKRVDAAVKELDADLIQLEADASGFDELEAILAQREAESVRKAELEKLQREYDEAEKLRQHAKEMADVQAAIDEKKRADELAKAKADAEVAKDERADAITANSAASVIRLAEQAATSGIKLTEEEATALLASTTADKDSERTLNEEEARQVLELAKAQKEHELALAKALAEHGQKLEVDAAGSARKIAEEAAASGIVIAEAQAHRTVCHGFVHSLDHTNCIGELLVEERQAE